MGTGLATAMVVFKSVLQFLFVFCIHVTYCKPAYDEQPEISGTGSTFWGWVTYLNPWGSAETSASPMSDKRINPNQTKIIPAAEARKLNAATIPVKQLTAQVSTSEKYMEHEVTTTPLKTVRIMATTELMAKQLLEPKAATADPLSDQNNLTSEQTAVEYSSDSTGSTVKAQDNSKTEFYLETEVPTTVIAIAQDISTSSEELIAVDLTTPTAWDLTAIAETSTEQPLQLETSTYVIAQSPSKINKVVEIDFLDLETPRILIIPKSTTEQLFEPDVNTISIMLDTDNATIVKEPLEVSKQSSALNTIRKNIIKGEPATDYLLELVLSTSNSVIVPEFTTTAIDPATEPPLESELVTNTQELEPQTTLSIYQNNTGMMDEFGSDQSLVLEATTSDLLEVEISSETVSTLSTILDEIMFSGRERYETHMGTDEPSTATHTTLPSLIEQEMVSKQTKKVTNVTESATVSYEVVGVVPKIEDGVVMATERVMDPYISLQDLMFKPYKKVIILIEPATDSYTSLHREILEPIFSDHDKNAYERVHEVLKAVEESTFTEPATDPYPEVTVAYPEVSEKYENSPEISEALITTVCATLPYLKIEDVSERDEGILAGAKIEVSVSKVLGLNQLVEIKETVLDEVNKISMETNAVLTALSDEMLTAVRFSRSQSAGSHLCFDHVRLMILLFAVYFMKT